MSRVPLPVRAMRAWPGPRTPDDARQWGGTMGKTTPGAALDRLRAELYRIGARDCCIEIAVSERNITRYGELRADARPAGPGVVVYATHPRQGDLRFACDTYRLWHRNVNAIALTLEALRGIARWGAVRDEQQFAGFRALPGATALTMGTSAATRILSEASGLTAPSPVTVDWLREARRRAMTKLHPDVSGDRAAWDELEAAIRVLGGGA